MQQDWLTQLCAELAYVDGLDVDVVEGGLAGTLVCRYGELPAQLDFEPATSAARLTVDVGVPPGTGPGFLVWLLAHNTSLWDVKLGLDEDGELLLHADLDLTTLDLPSQLSLLTRSLENRVQVMTAWLDDALIEYLRERDHATPSQLARWSDEDEGFDA